MQYYLWWGTRGSPATAGLTLPRGAIVVRAVRHHDDHARLDAGGADDYLPLTSGGDINEDVAGTPWTEAQERFVEGVEGVRLLHGRPGSGKTTALWRAVEARPGERVLYVSWSAALAREAEERFASFAPEDVEVESIDFTTLLGEINAADAARPTLAAARAAFAETVRTASRESAGVWTTRLYALHDEVRAVLLGMAVTGSDRTCAPHGITRLEDSEYRKARGGGETSGKTIRGVLKVARALPGGAWKRIFPDLAATTAAMRSLQSGRVAGRVCAFDRIVVDEAQDLTLAEQAVIVELCRHTGKTRGRMPRLLIAGDAGQTVRPTGFSWSNTADMIMSGIGKPAAYHLDEHVRCPNAIASVVDRASGYYSHIDKAYRPTKQQHQGGGQHIDAQLLRVEVANEAEGADLVRRLDAIDNVAVITPGEETPRWLPAELAPAVMRPSEAKGLEYHTVVVLDAGRAVGRLRQADAYAENDRMEQERQRTAIDHLRVALSRATETLAFVDVEATGDERGHSRELLQTTTEYSGEDLIEHAGNQERSSEERVNAYVAEAEQLTERSPVRAWRRASQAMALLGSIDRPNGVADLETRARARTTHLAIAARLLADRDGEAGAENVDAKEVLNRAVETIQREAAFAERKGPDVDTTTRERSRSNIQAIEQGALIGLLGWTDAEPTARSAFMLLEHAHCLARRVEPRHYWLRDVMASRAQALREELERRATEPESLHNYDARDLKAWLRATRLDEESAMRTAERLAQRAIDVATGAGYEAEPDTTARRRAAELAQALLLPLEPDNLRHARIDELSGHPDEAIAGYRRAGAGDDVLRVLRETGRWEEALPLSEGDDRKDLRWLESLTGLLAQRPRDHGKRLRRGERKRLAGLLESHKP